MSQITEFLPQLQQLRTVYTDFIELDEMDFDAFRKAVDFYYTHRDVGQFEKMMLDMLFEKDKQTLAIVLSSLKANSIKSLTYITKVMLFLMELSQNVLATISR